MIVMLKGALLSFIHAASVVKAVWSISMVCVAVKGVAFGGRPCHPRANGPLPPDF